MKRNTLYFIIIFFSVLFLTEESFTSDNNTIDEIKVIDIPVKTDHLYDKQWYLEKICIEKAWKYFPDFDSVSKVKIAVLEQGKFLKHIDFKDSLSKSYVVDLDALVNILERDETNAYYSQADQKIIEFNKIIKRHILKNHKENISNNLLNRLNPIEIIYKHPRRRKLVVKNKLSIAASTNQNKFDHATLVTGLISAKHGNYGIKGVCPFAEIIPVAFQYEETNDKSDNRINSKNFFGVITQLFEKEHPDIVNISRWFPRLENKSYAKFLEQYIDAWKDQFHESGKDIPIVISAGNEELNIDDHFILKPPFIPVGASLDDDKIADYSNRGQELSLFAPGGKANIVSTSAFSSNQLLNKYSVLEGGYAYDFQGTSASAPLVSGVVALMIAANPHLKYSDIIEILYMNSKTNCQGIDNFNNINKPKRLLNAKNAVKKSFEKLIDYWKNHWEKMSLDLNTYISYYSNKSLVIRGVVMNDNSIKYISYAGKMRNIDFKKEIKDFIDEKMQFIPVRYFCDSKIRPLDEFIIKMKELSTRYDEIRINLSGFDSESYEPSTCNYDQILLEFNQEYIARDKSDKVAYYDNGRKLLKLKRDGKEWFVDTEAWFYLPSNVIQVSNN